MTKLREKKTRALYTNETETQTIFASLKNKEAQACVNTTSGGIQTKGASATPKALQMGPPSATAAVAQTDAGLPVGAQATVTTSEKASGADVVQSRVAALEEELQLVATRSLVARIVQPTTETDSLGDEPTKTEPSKGVRVKWKTPSSWRSTHPSRT